VISHVSIEPIRLEPIRLNVLPRRVVAKAKKTAAEAAAIIQIGAPFDGSLNSLEAYKEALGNNPKGPKEIVIVAPPGILKRFEDNHEWNKQFDRRISLTKADSVLEHLKKCGVSVSQETHVIPAQEASVPLAYQLIAEIKQSSGQAQVFEPVGKLAMRRKVADALQRNETLHAERRGPKFSQPKFSALDIDSSHDIRRAGEEVGYPLVFKFSNGGGGLAVAKANNLAELQEIVTQHRNTLNYGGGELDHPLVEQFISGAEYSIQATADHHGLDVHGYCSKVVHPEPDGSFRELGHIARLPDEGASDLIAYAQFINHTLGYEDGPLQMDIQHEAESAGEEKFHVLDAGFRPSGMGVESLINMLHEHETIDGRPWTWARLAAAKGLKKHYVHTVENLSVIAAGTFVLRSDDEIVRAQNMSTPHLGVEVKDFRKAKSAKVQDVALTQRFGDNRGRIFLRAYQDNLSAADAERQIRDVFDFILGSAPAEAPGKHIVA
jgi:hypothetical protein